MRAVVIGDKYRNQFEEKLNVALSEPPKGMYVQDVQYSVARTPSNYYFSAMILYGDIPTT